MIETQRRKWWQTLIKLGWIFVLGVFIAVFLMYLVYLIPTSGMKGNVEESYKTLLEEGFYPNLNNKLYGSNGQLDNFTDSIMIEEAFYNDSNMSAIEKAMLNPWTCNPMGGLQELLNGQNESVAYYARYWHGYLIFLKPLLLVFGLTGIRILNLVLQLLLLVSICALMWKKCKKLIIPYLFSLLIICPFVISQSMQFSSIYYIFNFAVLFILIFYEKLARKDSFIFLFLIIGMLTSFFDFLTYPAATLVIPLTLLLYLRRNNGQTLKQNLIYILKMCATWAAGYLLFWASKWVASSLILNYDGFADGFRSVSVRAGSTTDNGASPLQVRLAAIYNIAKIFNLKNITLVSLMVVAIVAVGVVYRKKFKFKKENFVSLLLTALIPIVWYTLLGNHSQIHSFFTYRALAGSIFAILTMFVLFFEEKVEEKTVALESAINEVTEPECKCKKDKIAVIIPCYNEHLTIEKTVKRYKEALPDAKIYVYDNNSKDDSDKLAKKAGAIVRYEKNQGKGYVVRSMFKEIEAECYFMVDADDTYMADNAKEMCDLVLQGKADMVIGDRLSSTYFTEEKRKSHTFGNKLVRFLINTLYGAKVKDIMTGQRAFSRRFVKNFECKSNGFEIETEMTIFACDKNMVMQEIPVNYVDRPKGSFSKLNTYKDGIKVLKTIFKSYAKTHTSKFLGIASVPFAALGLIFMLPALLASSTALSILMTIMFSIFVSMNLAWLIVDLVKNIKKLKHKNV